MTEEQPLRVGSWNLTATFFSDPKDEKDPKAQMPQHWWANRKKFVKQAIEKAQCDVIGLQELSPEQALDLFGMFFPDRHICVFTQAVTDEVKAGQMYTTPQEIKEHLVGKFIGTALIAIMYDPRVVVRQSSGMFWYNPKPFEPPVATDRSATDKGFGNMNTPRGPGYVKFKHVATAKDFYFFTSHAPISGGADTRIKCFECENQVIKQLTNGVPFFSVGDRNLFPDDKQRESYRALTKDVHNWLNILNHKGFLCTWLGFKYEPLEYQTQVSACGAMQQPKMLDVGTSSLQSVFSAHYHCVIRDEVELLGELTEEDNATRNFASDHAMLVAHFVI